MTTQQAVAIGTPCEFAEQCADQKYRRIQRSGPYIISVIVTVNVGEE